MAQSERVARIVFGKDGLGYVRNVRQEQVLEAAVALTMLVNRSPYLETLTSETLQAAKQLVVYNKKHRVEALGQVARALMYLDIVSTNAFPSRFDTPVSSVWWEYRDPDVDPRWIAWLQAYVTQTHGIAESYRKNVFYYLIIAGRWLKQYHPTIVTPDRWDEALAHEYVAYGFALPNAASALRGICMRPHTHLVPRHSHCKPVRSMVGSAR